MSRKSVENRLSRERSSESRWGALGVFATAFALGTGVDALRNINTTSGKIDLGELSVAAASLAMGILGLRNSSHYSHTAAQLEGVLAQDELYQPEQRDIEYPEDTVFKDGHPVFFDQEQTE
jgi:hypothetical protein